MDSCDIVGPHVNSYNYLVSEGLEKAIKDIDPEQFQLNIPNMPIVTLKFSSIKIDLPTSAQQSESIVNVHRIYPSECRQRGISYSGKLKIRIEINVGGRELEPIDKALGDFPVMVKSKLCNLSNLSVKEMMKKGEEEREMGGYFIVNGTEKIIRLLIVNRRNYPMAVARNGWKKRGATYTEFGIYMRCVRDNHTATLNTLHYLMTRRMMLCFLYRKEMFFVPLLEIIRALVDYSESYIFDTLMCGRRKDDVWEKSVKNMLKDLRDDGLMTRQDALKHIGESFRGSLYANSWLTDAEVGKLLLRKCVLIHLNDDKEKFELLSYMAQKLRAFVAGECREDNPDNIMFHEVALPGHILLLMMKEKLEQWLSKLRRQLEDDVKKRGADILVSRRHLNEVVKTAARFDILRLVEYFLSTGTLNSQTGLGLQQITGFTIIAERLNYLRFVSHFRGIHRGAFFTTMRATDVRKLRPEAWGFLCPVHTPDGTPCGLLNHLTASCRVVCEEGNFWAPLISLLSTCGMLSLDEFRSLSMDSNEHCVYFRVFVDSRWLGWIAEEKAQRAAHILRAKKIEAQNAAGISSVLQYAEVTFVPKPSKSTVRSLYPGLYILTNSARLVRPVRNLVHNAIEFIGTFEQVYLSICIDKSEFHEGVTTHQEMNPHAILSFVANLIPFSDHNQSPRNVYQCQMGKQTMGVPVHRFDRRVDNKLYRLQTPQSPLVKPASYDTYGIDDYALGTNAIVAVISYTGYDMEDSMVINKTSYERGFAQASVIKCERINLIDVPYSNRRQKVERRMFLRDPSNQSLVDFVDSDGLPYVGKMYRENDPYHCIVSLDSGKFTVKPYHHFEPAYVSQVIACDNDNTSYHELNHICITWRAERNPSMGDKFASRHGQKGMMSFLWPAENMPFTESGMVPDIIFNPHGFPSRMTVGMMIEFLAGKSAALHGLKHNAAPFIFSEENPAVKYFGDLLTKAGYNYLGNEPLYSGVDGREIKADIFFGIVYYQKLRHMVEDKFQVRSTGPVQELTGQPVHGRKRGGGVRFGEMERDGLISHGCAFLLQDRLFNCSDKDYTEVCSKCGRSLGIYKQVPPSASKRFVDSTLVSYCRICESSENIKIVSVPTVLKLLIAELDCMNIKMCFNTSS